LDKLAKWTTKNLSGGTSSEVFVNDNNNNNDRLTAFDPGQPG